MKRFQIPIILIFLIFLAIACDQPKELVEQKQDSTDTNLGLRPYKEAIDLNDSYAVYYQGHSMLYPYGDDEAYSPDSAEWYLKRAVVLGNPYAMWTLGLEYCTGEHLKKNEPEGLRLLHQAASLNLPQAYFSLAQHFSGKDLDSAYHYIQLRKGGNCKFEYGKLLVTGMLFEKPYPKVERNKEQGLALLEEAANDTVPEAAYFLAKIYETGSYNGQPDDTLPAIRNAQKAKSFTLMGDYLQELLPQD